ncbi:MAG TPA: alpha/beta fold hydrolase, partial [Acidimicrobiales bacterium]|nr:alpha/beta fold hydrolase [Acidimicrobiales bacterium]
MVSPDHPIPAAAGSEPTRTPARDLPLAPAPVAPPRRPLRVVPEGERAPRSTTAAPGRWLDLGSRGRTWIREDPGPEGAPALVMLHGLGATGGLNWAGAQYVLRDQFRMITIDHRGHGRGIRTKRFTLEDCADDAAAAIEALGAGPAIAVGYSMGGPIASLLWRRHPDLVAGMVLCATSRNFRGSPAEKLAFAGMGLAGSSPVLLPDRLVRAWGSLVCSLPVPLPEQVRDVRFLVDELAGHDPRSIVQATAAIGEFNSSGWIGQVDVPTSVVVCTNDQLVPPIRQFRLARAIPGATVRCVKGGHMCVAGGTAKERFLAALRQSCLEVASGG